MKNRLLLLMALLSFAIFAFACGAPTNTTNNANANKPANSMTNTVTNTLSNAVNTVSNMASNAVNTVSNAVSNKPANTAANKTAANKPPKGSTFECNDGTYSDAKNAQGACSSHGGIKKKLP